MSLQDMLPSSNISTFLLKYSPCAFSVFGGHPLCNWTVCETSALEWQPYLAAVWLYPKCMFPPSAGTHLSMILAWGISFCDMQLFRPKIAHPLIRTPVAHRQRSCLFVFSILNTQYIFMSSSPEHTNKSPPTQKYILHLQTTLLSTENLHALVLLPHPLATSLKINTLEKFNKIL